MKGVGGDGEERLFGEGKGERGWVERCVAGVDFSLDISMGGFFFREGGRGRIYGFVGSRYLGYIYVWTRCWRFCVKSMPLCQYGLIVSSFHVYVCTQS